MEASLANLINQSDGPMLSELAMDVYWLYDDGTHIPWSYYDSLGGRQPWYIAYVVTNPSDLKIRLLSPLTKDMPENCGILFNWDTEGGELSDYNVYISYSKNFTPSQVIYRKFAGAEKSLDPVTFIPEPGKTYFWRVSGLTGSGDMVWSPPETFSIKGKENTTTDGTSLKAVIYPNPGYAGEIRMAISAEDAGTASCAVYSVGGELVFRKDIVLAGSGKITTITLPAYIGKGVYIAEINCNGKRINQKLVVL